MSSSSTAASGIEDYYIVCSFSGVCALVAVAISIMILIAVWRTKPSLHTVRHLLVCNTCIASMLYCIVQTVNYVYLIFFPEYTSDISCRWRGYFAYISICGVAYSFLIQAISRMLISIYSRKYRWLIKYKVHRILICIQWFVSILIPLPAIITKDIYFRPNSLCWVPLKRTIHVSYTYTAYYIIPVLSIALIYIFIYYRVQQTVTSAEIRVRSAHNDNRDVKLLRNIFILVAIYLIGGIPTLLFLVTSIRTLYLIGIVTISLAVAVEKVCTILLDRELRQVIRKLLLKTTRVTPIDNVQMIAKYHGNFMHTQPVFVQTISSKQHISLNVMRIDLIKLTRRDHVKNTELYLNNLN